MTNKISDLDQPSLHYALSGEVIDYVSTNGTILVIRTTTGREVKVAWVDDNGDPIKGKPALAFAGLRVVVEGAKLFG